MSYIRCECSFFFKTNVVAEVSRVVDERRLVKDQWRNGWGKRPKDPKFFDTSQLVPLKFEDICDWAQVVGKAVIIDNNRRRDVVYAGEGESDKDEESDIVVVRFQGFLDAKFNIGITGTWNGCVIKTTIF